MVSGLELAIDIGQFFGKRDQVRLDLGPFQGDGGNARHGHDLVGFVRSQLVWTICDGENERAEFRVLKRYRGGVKRPAAQVGTLALEQPTFRRLGPSGGGR